MGSSASREVLPRGGRIRACCMQPFPRGASCELQAKGGYTQPVLPQGVGAPPHTHTAAPLAARQAASANSDASHTRRVTFRV